jgi:MFS family permease
MPITNLRSRLAGLVAGSPLAFAPFRRFYVGSAATAVGYTMQAAMAAWLMSTLTPSALMVAMVQSASTVPFLLFGLIAGALADIVDRRKVVIVTQVVMFLSTLLLGTLTLMGAVGPALLLLLTVVCGSGFTFYMPAQQASVNELVSRDLLSRAVALGAVAFNVARAIGPAVAGFVAAAFGSGIAILISAVFFLPMIIGMAGLKPVERSLPGVPETLLSGVQSGLRYARHSTAMRSLIILNLSFCLCASALWALMPVIARDQLGLGAGGFGILFGTFGAGAVISALSIPGQLQRRSLNTVVRGSVVLWIGASTVVALSNIVAIALVGAFAAGAAWVGVLASLSAGTQSSAPGWVRARALAINLIAVQAGLAIGSILWGTLASWFGTPVTLGAAALAMLVLYAANHRVHVELGDEADVTPFAQLPELPVIAEPLPDDGPVLVQVEYRIEPARRAEFLDAIAAVEATRRRNGATSWRVFRDVSEAGRYVERYVITSWAEYVRLRMRMTVAERRIQNRVAQLQRADVPIHISRLIGVDTHERRGHHPRSHAASGESRTVMPTEAHEEPVGHDTLAEIHPAAKAAVDVSAGVAATAGTAGSAATAGTAGSAGVAVPAVAEPGASGGKDEAGRANLPQGPAGEAHSGPPSSPSSTP